MQTSEKPKKELKFSKRSLGMKALVKYIETSKRDRAMSKDTGELIIRKSIILCYRPIFSFLSLVIAQNVRFSQSLPHTYVFADTKVITLPYLTLCICAG